MVLGPRTAVLWLLAAPSAPDGRAAAGPTAAPWPESPSATAPAPSVLAATPAPVEAAPRPPPPPPPPARPPPTEPKPPKRAGPKFTPGVQAFVRGQGRVNPDFDNGRDTDADIAEVLERIRLQALGEWGPVSVFAQVQDARTWGFEAGTATNEANTDLHQGYLELGADSKPLDLDGSVRIGRQEVSWGSQRMIGGLNWLPTARSFDAVRLQGRAGKFALDIFGALLANPQQFTTPDPADPMATLTVRSTGGQLVAAQVAVAAHSAFNIEALALSDFADAHPNDLARERAIYDGGARIWGEPVAGLRYEGEAHGQAGHRRGLVHRAWAWAGSVGYAHPQTRVKPGAYAGYAMASGSKCTAVPDATRSNCDATIDRDFFNFYPTNHMHYGLADRLGWINMRDLEFGANLAFKKLVKASAAYHFFQMHRPDGAWRQVAGAPVGAGWDPTNTGATLGHEIDATVTIKPWKPMMIQPGYGVFIPDGVGRRLGGPDAQHFIYLWLVVTI